MPDTDSHRYWESITGETAPEPEPADFDDGDMELVVSSVEEVPKGRLGITVEGQ